MQVEKVRGASGAPDLGKPRSIEGPAPKASPAEANYGDAEQKCSTCEHFDGTDGCSKVEGVIDPNGHSRFYSRNTMNDMVNDEEENEGEYEAL